MPKNLEVNTLLDFYGNVLTQKQRDVMQQYYCDDLSLGEISENFGISRQGVRDTVKRAEAVLEDMEQKVGLVKQQQSLHQKLAQLEQLAERIFDQSKNCPVPAIRQDSQKMLEILTSVSE